MLQDFVATGGAASKPSETALKLSVRSGLSRAFAAKKEPTPQPRRRDLTTERVPLEKKNVEQWLQETNMNKNRHSRRVAGRVRFKVCDRRKFKLPVAPRGGAMGWIRRPLCFCGTESFFFLHLPYGQYGPVSQLSRSEESCTGPFNWGEAHCAGEKVKRKIGPFLWKSLKNQTRTRTQQKGAQPATATRNPLARLPGARAHEETNPTSKRLHQQILVRLNVLDLQWTIL